MFIEFFVETTFLEKIFLTRRMHSQHAQLKKFVVTFVVKIYGSETKKKSTTLNFSLRVFLLKIFLWTVERQCEKLWPNFSTKFLKEFTQCPKTFEKSEISSHRRFSPKTLLGWKMQLPQICKKNWPKFKKYITESRKWTENSRFLFFKKQICFLKTIFWTNRRQFSKPRPWISATRYVFSLRSLNPLKAKLISSITFYQEILHLDT